MANRGRARSSGAAGQKRKTARPPDGSAPHSLRVRDPCFVNSVIDERRRRREGLSSSMNASSHAGLSSDAVGGASTGETGREASRRPRGASSRVPGPKDAEVSSIASDVNPCDETRNASRRAPSRAVERCERRRKCTRPTPAAGHRVAAGRVSLTRAIERDDKSARRVSGPLPRFLSPALRLPSDLFRFALCASGEGANGAFSLSARIRRPARRLRRALSLFLSLSVFARARRTREVAESGARNRSGRTEGRGQRASRVYMREK